MALWLHRSLGLREPGLSLRPLWIKKGPGRHQKPCKPTQPHCLSWGVGEPASLPSGFLLPGGRGLERPPKQFSHLGSLSTSLWAAVSLPALAHGYPQGPSCPTHRPDLVRALRTRGTWVPSWPWTPRSGLALFSWHPDLSSALLGPPGAGSRAQAPGPLPASGDFRRSLLAWAPQLHGGGWRCGPRTRPSETPAVPSMDGMT